MAKGLSVFGIYSKRSDMEAAASALKEAGIPMSNISVLLPENPEKQPVAESSTKAPEGAAVGAGSGAAVGGTLGWLVGVGALAIPGIGPVLAAGPIVAAIAGIGVGGALGGFAGCLVGVGISEDEARLYEGRLAKGSVLIAIHCETAREAADARKIMERTGAENVGSTREALPSNANIAAIEKAA